MKLLSLETPEMSTGLEPCSLHICVQASRTLQLKKSVRILLLVGQPQSACRRWIFTNATKIHRQAQWFSST